MIKKKKKQQPLSWVDANGNEHPDAANPTPSPSPPSTLNPKPCTGNANGNEHPDAAHP